MDDLTHAMFGMVGIVMKAAPVGAFGGMAFTIGKYGIPPSPLALMGTVYGTMMIFIFVVLGAIMRMLGFDSASGNISKTRSSLSLAPPHPKRRSRPSC